MKQPCAHAPLHMVALISITLVISLLTGACGSDTDLPAVQTLPDDPSTTLRLTPRQTLNAISARSRMARGGMKPTETLTRIYDADGKVLVEFVRRNGEWIERPSTLPTQLEMRPLDGFISGGPTAAIMIAGRVDTTTWVDANSFGSFERLTTDSSGAAQYLEHDGGTTYGTTSGEIYYNSPADIADPASSTAGVVYFCSYTAYCDDNNIEEMQLAGTDWAAVVAEASSVGPANLVSQNLALGATCLPGIGDAGTRTERIHTNGTLFMQASYSAMAKQDPCLTLKYAAGLAVGSFVVNGAATVACSSFLAWMCGTAAPVLAARINTTGYAALSTLVLFNVCRLNHPIGSW